MARRDLVGEFAKKPTGFKVGVFAAIGLLLGLIYYQFFYSPLKTDKARVENQYRKLENKNKELKKSKQEFDDLLKTKDQLETELRTNRLSLPAAAELPSYYGNLQRQAAAAGVRLSSTKPGKEVPVSKYLKVPVSISVSGTFYQINSYFKLLSETERIITVENMTLSKPRVVNDEMVINASFTASTFRRPDNDNSLDLGAEDETAPAKKGAKPGAKTGSKTGAPPNATEQAKKKVGDANAKRGSQLDGAAGQKPSAPAAGGATTEDKTKAGTDRVKNPPKAP